MAVGRTALTGLAHAGIGPLVRAARRAAGCQGRGLVLMYHRLAREPDYLGLCVSPHWFDAQMTTLRRRAPVVPLRELVARVMDPTPLEHDIAAITFDDGYRDNLDIAAPILAKHGLPATVFVTTGFIDGSVKPMGERLEDAACSLWRRACRASAWDGTGCGAGDTLVRSVLTHPGSLAHVRALAVWLTKVDGSTVELLLDRFEALAGTAGLPSTRMLDWAGVRTLAGSGVEIGSHTTSHPILSQVGRERAAAEIVASKHRLEREIGDEIAGFAFPNGNTGDFTDNDVTLARGAGYAYACTAQRGVNRCGADPYRLLRVGAGDYGPALFDLKVAVGR